MSPERLSTAGARPAPPSAVLDVSAVAMWRGEQCLFEALDFTAASGTLVLVVGPNGAGKTTLLRALAGLTPPTSGRIEWNGTDVRALPLEERGLIAYRGHAEGVKRDLTVRENLDFVRRIMGGKDRIDAVADTLRLGAKLDVRARHLSAGQRRRVGLGALRLGGARLWVLDEPMTHLDSAGRQLVAEWIREHVDAGGIAVVATHQADELARAGTLMVEL